MNSSCFAEYIYIYICVCVCVCVCVYGFVLSLQNSFNLSSPSVLQIRHRSFHSLQRQPSTQQAR